MSNQTQENNLAKLTTAHEKVVVTSTQLAVTIAQVKVKQLSKFADFAQKIAPALKQTKTYEEVDIPSLVFVNIDSVIDLLPVCTSLEKEQVDQLEIDDLILIVAAIVEVNVDFFMKRVLPAIQKASTELEATFTKLDGPTPLSA